MEEGKSSRKGGGGCDDALQGVFKHFNWDLLHLQINTFGGYDEIELSKIQPKWNRTRNKETNET